MPPKKAKKIPLNEFLVDNSLGSWADEMDSLPTAPAPRNDDDYGRPGDRYGRRDDFLSSRPDRALGPPRDDLPLPTQPPFTAFVGNLAFDLTEAELGDFFAPAKTKSVKIIRDREDRPKGFGYIEFEDIEGLKESLSKTGSNFSGRTVRVSVAEPPKERSFLGSGGNSAHEDDTKFDSPWRRDGPLPDRDQPRSRRFESSVERLPSVAEGANEWRSARPSRPLTADVEPPTRRRGSGFSAPDGSGPADTADSWTRGAKFVPSVTQEPQRFGNLRGREVGNAPDDGDWRRPTTQSSISPESSTPPTPQLGRRKLDLLPRSGSNSVSPSPLSSPRMAPAVSVSSSSRASPFGAAKPVDVTSREKEVSERVDKDRLSMSRTNSRTGYERSPLNSSARTPPPGSMGPPPPPASNAIAAEEKPVNGATGQCHHQSASLKPPLASNVRPSVSFASAAAAKRGGEEDVEVEKLAEKTVEVAVI